jgi:hypothetical protein
MFSRVRRSRDRAAVVAAVLVVMVAVKSVTGLDVLSVRGASLWTYTYGHTCGNDHFGFYNEVGFSTTDPPCDHTPSRLHGTVPERRR